MVREHPHTIQSRKHFDLLAAQYDALFVPRLGSYEAMHDAILSMLPPSHERALRVLELGPGTGNLTRKVLERLPNSRVVGYELSAEMLAQAREKLTPMIDRVCLIEADISQGAFDGPFDVVVSAIAVHHVPPRAKPALFRRLYSALQPGGALIIGDTFRAATPALDATYRQLRAAAASDATSQTAAYEAYRQQAGPAGGSSTHLSNYLRWLGQSGFHSVDCVWKHFSLAVVYGERPLAA
jgi:tRNA (cmo5U34)-methyltransferase